MATSIEVLFTKGYYDGTHLTGHEDRSLTDHNGKFINICNLFSYIFNCSAPLVDAPCNSTILCNIICYMMRFCVLFDFALCDSFDALFSVVFVSSKMSISNSFSSTCRLNLFCFTLVRPEVFHSIRFPSSFIFSFHYTRHNRSYLMKSQNSARGMGFTGLGAPTTYHIT